MEEKKSKKILECVVPNVTTCYKTLKKCFGILTNWTLWVENRKNFYTA